MNDQRPLTYVRFKHPVSLGNQDGIMEWTLDRPYSTLHANTIKVRCGDPDRGEPRDSVIFEIRNGKDAYDDEVPRGNIAQLRRAAVPPKEPPKQEGKKP